MLRLVPILTLASAALAQARVTWEFSFEDPAGAGFNHPVLGPERRQALMDVATYVGSVFGNTGTIQVLVEVSRDDPFGATLAAGGPYYTAFDGFSNGLPFDHGTTGVDPLAGDADSQLIVNFGRNYYLGEDPAGISATEIDFRTVLLHELTHIVGVSVLTTGTGASSFPRWPDGSGRYTGFESLLYKGQTDADPLFPGAVYDNNPGDLESNDIWFRGPAAMAANGGNPVQVYAPSGFSPSSLVHFEPGTDSVMVPRLDGGVVRRTYSPIDRGVLSDLGWTVVPEPGTMVLLLLPALAAIRRRRS